MSLLWTDGTWTSATAVTSPEYSCPIPGVATAYVLKQDFQQFIANYAPLAMGTAHATATDFILVAESEVRDIGGGVGRWTRTYAKVPASHSEYETFGYTFIGYMGAWGINVTSITGRDRVTRIVPSQVVHEYYETGTSPATPGDIEIVPAQTYKVGTIDVDYLDDGPPSGILDTASDPTRTEYEGWITNSGTYGWSAGATPDGTNPGKICVEDSKIERWMGPIWVRKTRYVLAQ